MNNLHSAFRNIKKTLRYSKMDLTFKRKNWDKVAIFLMGEPEYNNLGDHAIAYATQKYIENKFLNNEYIGISESDVLYNFKNVFKLVRKGDIILLQGGGNMGDVYPDQVILRKKVIEGFKLNQIVVMPQTIHFDDNDAKLPSYYDQNKGNLTLVAREQVSYDIMRNQYAGEVLLTPDIVLFLASQMDDKESDRNGTLICLRSDKERNSNALTYTQVFSYLELININYEAYSTVIGESVKSDDRERYLEKLFDKFLHSELIITDRLHAMIIAAITKTPCIVLPTFNHKVIGSYQWLKELNYIVMLQSPDQFSQKIKELLTIGEKKQLDVEEYYAPLYNCISEKLGDSRI